MIEVTLTSDMSKEDIKSKVTKILDYIESVDDKVKITFIAGRAASLEGGFQYDGYTLIIEGSPTKLPEGDLSMLKSFIE